MCWKWLKEIDMPEGRFASENADLDAVIKDVAALKNDLGRLMEHAKADATETVNDGARRFYGAMAAEGDRSVAAISRSVEARPITSLLVAFAVGFLGGRMLAR